MIVKNFELKKKLSKKINFYLLYGSNSGLIDETIENVLKPNFSKNHHLYEENEILNDIENFKESIFNLSFFENDKLIIINRVSDKIYNLIEEIFEKKISDINIILKSNILEKKSKLRNFFEKNSHTIIVPFYEDNFQTLFSIAKNFFNEKKIRISPQNINLLVERCNGDRKNLKNELDKIILYCYDKNSVDFEEISNLTNLAENYSISELTDQCLAKNKNKTLNILNENNHSTEDNILILKIFLYKLKRLKKLKSDLEIQNNLEDVLSSFRPPIFWKDKEIIKQQLKYLSLNQIKNLIKKVNNLEVLVKKNSQISKNLIHNFILERL
ncbi:DNA polymerase III subunit delta [Candidatus Pelagibacter sp.]|nr:DNA polymerase III subunit delta [Candidatus Pelagibacter sp.]